MKKEESKRNSDSLKDDGEGLDGLDVDSGRNGGIETLSHSLAEEKTMRKEGKHRVLLKDLLDLLDVLDQIRPLLHLVKRLQRDEKIISKRLKLWVFHDL